MYNFDFEVSNKKQDWISEQKIFTLWEKIPLMVHVRVQPVKEVRQADFSQFKGYRT